jgi:hypothetical protein
VSEVSSQRRTESWSLGWIRCLLVVLTELVWYLVGMNLLRGNG